MERTLFAFRAANRLGFVVSSSKVCCNATVQSGTATWVWTIGVSSLHFLLGLGQDGLHVQSKGKHNNILRQNNVRLLFSPKGALPVFWLGLPWPCPPPPTINASPPQPIRLAAFPSRGQCIQ